MPINIGSITDIIDSTNTGLGTKRFSDGRMNDHAELELKQFNEIFSEVATDDMRRKIYKRENDKELYEEATEKDKREYGSMYLSVTQCRRLMEMVTPKKNANDGENKNFVDVIYDKLRNANIDSVFGEKLPDTELEESTPEKAKTEETKTKKIKSEKTKAEDTKSKVSEAESNPENAFEYELWNVGYTAKSLTDLMHNVFDVIAEKYPGCVPAMADSDEISAVARKEDVDNRTLLPNKMDYFRMKKEHWVEGILYYVSTRYNRGGGITQLERMLSLCEGNSDAFKIIKEPVKAVRNTKSK